MSGAARKARPYGESYRRAMREHAQERGATRAEMAALNVLLNHINYETGQSWPGRATIMREAGYRSEKPVKAAMRGLRELQLIRPIAYATGGRGRATCYAFALPAYAKPVGRVEAPARPPEPAGAGDLWGRICAQYAEAAPDSYRAWVAGLTFERLTAGTVELTAPNSYAAQYCETHIAPELARIAAQIEPAAQRVRVAA